MGFGSFELRTKVTLTSHESRLIFPTVSTFTPDISNVSSVEDKTTGSAGK